MVGPCAGWLQTWYAPGMLRFTCLLCAAIACGTARAPEPTQAPEPAPTQTMVPVQAEPKAPTQATVVAADSEASVRPGANDKFLDPKLDVASWVKRFEGESREVYAARAAILNALQLSPGAAVADIGAGTGFFADLFSRAVGEEGRVYANDISPRFLDHLRQRKSQSDWRNVSIVVGTERSVNLPKASVDVVFVCDVYHHFEYPKSVLESIRRALKPGGQLVIVDFKRIDGVSSKWILGHVRASEEVFSSEIESAGFELEGNLRVPGLSDNYIIRFRKP